ncbi:MAG: YtxH domain-containing protein [Dysgonomonas sp.]
MNRLLLGLIVGAGLGVLFCKMREEGKLEGMCDDLNRFGNKFKRNLKNAADVGRNEAEYLKDRAESKIEKGKDKLDSIIN